MQVLGHSKTETTLKFTRANIGRMIKALERLTGKGYNPARVEGEAAHKDVRAVKV
jgi:hypothetical protein